MAAAIDAVLDWRRSEVHLAHEKACAPGHRQRPAPRACAGWTARTSGPCDRHRSRPADARRPAAPSPSGYPALHDQAPAYSCAPRTSRRAWAQGSYRANHARSTRHRASRSHRSGLRPRHPGGPDRQAALPSAADKPAGAPGQWPATSVRGFALAGSSPDWPAAAQWELHPPGLPEPWQTLRGRETQGGWRQGGRWRRVSC